MSRELNPVNTGKAIGKALKAVTEADRNQMHLDRIAELAENFSEDEAYILAKKLIEKYPDIVFTTFKDHYEWLLHTNQAFMAVAGGVK